MGSDFPLESFRKVIHLAHLCTQVSGNDRPTMDEVVRKLELIKEEAVNGGLVESANLTFKRDDEFLDTPFLPSGTSGSAPLGSVDTSDSFVTPVSVMYGTLR